MKSRIIILICLLLILLTSISYGGDDELGIFSSGDDELSVGANFGDIQNNFLEGVREAVGRIVQAIATRICEDASKGIVAVSLWLSIIGLIVVMITIARLILQIRAGTVSLLFYVKAVIILAVVALLIGFFFYIRTSYC